MDLPDDAGRPEFQAAITAFVESRPYVANLISLDLSFTPDLQDVDWCVPTSATHHDIIAGGEKVESDTCVHVPVDEGAYA